MDHLDPALVSLAAKLDHLAHQERSLPDAGFEARIIAHVQASKQSHKLVQVGESEPVSPAMQTRRSGASGSFWAMRLAAAIAIMSGIGAVWMASRAPSTSQNLVASGGSSTGSGSELQNNVSTLSPVKEGQSVDDSDLLLAVAFGDESVDDLQDLREITESLEVSIGSRLDVQEYFSDEGAT